MGKYLIIFTTTLLLLAGCSVRSTYGPNGEEAYFANCDSETRCQYMAGNKCGSAGYEVLRNYDSKGYSYGFGVVGGGGGSGKNGFIFKCK